MTPGATSTSSQDGRRRLIMPDFEVPGRYLRENFDREDRLAVVLIHRETERVEQKLATAEQIASPKFQAQLRSANANGRDVFISMNTIRAQAVGRTKADVDVVRHISISMWIPGQGSGGADPQRPENAESASCARNEPGAAPDYLAGRKLR